LTPFLFAIDRFHPIDRIDEGAVASTDTGLRNRKGLVQVGW